MAEVTLTALEFDEFRETAFQKLAAYIFGGNVAEEKMGKKHSEAQADADRLSDYPKHPSNDLTRASDDLTRASDDLPRVNDDTTSPSDTKKSETIAMTAPVLQEEGFNKEWTMSFVLPKKYTLQTAPKPLNDEVQLRDVAGYDAAVVRYSGTNTSQAIKEHQTKLIAWLKNQPDHQLKGTFFSAQYDAPFVLPFLRRNEVMIKIGNLQ